jgi:hypothetical protein
MTIHEIVAETDNYLLTNSLFAKRLLRENMRIGTLSTDPEMVAEVLRDKDNNFKSVISRANCSDYAKSKLSHLFTMILAEENNENADYDLLFRKIIDFESEMTEDKALNDGDRRLILISTSIARHSLYFWYTNSPESINGRVSRKWWEWLIVGACDVAGGVAGCSVAGAAGAISGAVAASSAGASLLEWAQK